MIERIRRALHAPRRPTPFVTEMQDVRREAVLQSRETLHRIHRLNRVMHDGEIDYDELNRAMFGRPGWPRGEDRNVLG